MPRPVSGYHNRAGQPVPGTHDPLKRFTQPGGLINWAYGRGKQGLPLYDKTAIDIGSTVHAMAEMDLKGRPDREIEAYVNNCLTAPEHLRKAWSSFQGFREWRQQCQVRAITQELPMVSEHYQFGGTPDTIAIIGNGLGLLDFKTCSKPAVYPEMLFAMAAHGQLWEETHPDQPLTGGYHLILLPKDGSPFQHHHFDDLNQQWEIFKLLLQAYQLEQGAVAPKAKPETNWEPLRKQLQESLKVEQARVVKLETKPRVRVKASAEPRMATMADILRGYGHIPAEYV